MQTIGSSAPTTSRAVVRFIEPGSLVTCTGCDGRLNYMAKSKPKQVVCNVYENGKWNRVEHWHVGCYNAAGSPHGDAQLALQHVIHKPRKTE